ncbi:MAG TPA: hypothetical protein VIO64_00795 [Pseudobacteroides sp.]|uniref:hypothetical protein n=1 Tax=Pseudobacteroides sp. TaxID=1968840 RepID=UPI002F947318
MELEPIKKYKQPRYPQKYAILEDPDLLKNIPNRWRTNVYVCIAASTLLAIGLSGCGKLAAEEAGSVTDTIYASPTSSPSPVTTVSKEAKAHDQVAAPPIFKYGDGIGSFGCVSVAPPVFLSEEEAYKVVIDEAEKYGIKFSRNDLVIKDMEIPSTKAYPVFDNANSKKVNSISGDLTVDGYDNDRKIGFEFVSKEDYTAWKADQGYASTVEQYLTYDAAKVLREGLVKEKSDVSIGVFYDPMEPTSEKLKGDINLNDFSEEKLRIEATDKLREQVKDFFSWLKAQGII